MQRLEHLADALYLPVVGVDGVVSLLPQEVGIAVGVLVGDILHFDLGIPHELHELAPGGLVRLPLAHCRWRGALRALAVLLPCVAQRKPDGFGRVQAEAVLLDALGIFRVDDFLRFGVVPGPQPLVVAAAVGLVAEVEPAARLVLVEGSVGRALIDALMLFSHVACPPV